MKSLHCPWRFASSFLAFAFVSLSALPSMAAVAKATGAGPGVEYNHCTFYKNPLCEGSNKSKFAIMAREGVTALPTWSGQGGTKQASLAVDLDNVCRWVDKGAANTQGEDIFVPFRTTAEWLAFVGNAPAKYVTLAKCARPGRTWIPPNDPARASDLIAQCYNPSGVLQTTNSPWTGISVYGREGERRTVAPSGISFSCYTQSGIGPWIKTPTQAVLEGKDSDRKNHLGTFIGSTGDRVNNSDWQAISVNYTTTTVSGACGSANGRSLTYAPSGGELCTRGMPSGVNGSGPWSWTCKGYNSQGYNNQNGNCSAQKTAPTCPPVSVYGPPSMIGPLANPIGAGYVDIRVSGSGGGRARSSGAGSDGKHTRYGSCDYYSSFDLGVFVNCIVTQFVRNNVPGYSNMQGSCSVSGGYISPLKVSLTGGDAVMNATKPTTFYLTLKDERVLKGYATGGLNPGEGWLMVHRDGGALVYRDGALNADNWFGDRDGRTLNGYTDLAETFKAFIEKDEYGQRFFPLRVLTSAEKEEVAANPVKGGNPDPSFALRVLDANNTEHFASDYFSRIYVDYRAVNEGDGPKGEVVNNVILERGIVRTLNGENRAAVDQWFVLDLPPGLGPVKGQTKSKILPKGSKKAY